MYFPIFHYYNPILANLQLTNLVPQPQVVPTFSATLSNFPLLQTQSKQIINLEQNANGNSNSSQAQEANPRISRKKPMPRVYMLLFRKLLMSPLVIELRTKTEISCQISWKPSSITFLTGKGWRITLSFFAKSLNCRMAFQGFTSSWQKTFRNQSHISAQRTWEPSWGTKTTLRCSSRSSDWSWIDFISNSSS